jgi:hypothetical protein
MKNTCMRFLSFAVISILFQACFNSEKTENTVNPIVITGNTVQVQSGSRFLGQLQTVPLASAPGGERRLKTVGQMIAVANASGDLLHEGVSWVSLDPDLNRELGIHLSNRVSIGYAYGVTSITDSYKAEIRVGERVEIYRYGLKQSSTAGSVVSVQKGSLAGEYSVVFSVMHGQDWYPGTNCEVEFPLVSRMAVALSPLSMLHEGVKEYVMKEISPGKFQAKEITVLNETPNQVFALGDLSPGDRVVERGAILLKPTIHEMIVQAKEANRVR